jgi:hypothetical protein
MRAVLSDDHNYERGLASLNGLVDLIVRENGSTGVRDVAVALSLALATALERIAQDQRTHGGGPGGCVVRRMTTRAALPRVFTPDGVMPAPLRRGDTPRTQTPGCIEGPLVAGEGGERCRPGAHGGRPDLRSGAGPGRRAGPGA